MVYEGTCHKNRWFGATLIDGKPHFCILKAILERICILFSPKTMRLTQLKKDNKKTSAALWDRTATSRKGQPESTPTLDVVGHVGDVSDGHRYVRSTSNGVPRAMSSGLGLRSGETELNTKPDLAMATEKDGVLYHGTSNINSMYMYIYIHM